MTSFWHFGTGRPDLSLYVPFGPSRDVWASSRHDWVYLATLFAAKYTHSFWL